MRHPSTFQKLGKTFIKSEPLKHEVIKAACESLCTVQTHGKTKHAMRLYPSKHSVGQYVSRLYIKAGITLSQCRQYCSSKAQDKT